MVLDNCPAHPNVQDALKAIKLIFLPPNTTSKLQPCDQGIIQNMKVHCRKFQLIRMIKAVEAKDEFSLSLLDSVYMLCLAWDNVRPETIKNCFEHCGFKLYVPTSESANTSDSATTSGTENETCLLDRLCVEGVQLSEDVTFDTFMNVDSCVENTAELSDVDIVAMVQKRGETDTEDTNELDDSTVPPPPPTVTKTTLSLQVLK